MFYFYDGARMVKNLNTIIHQQFTSLLFNIYGSEVFIPGGGVCLLRQMTQYQENLFGVQTMFLKVQVYCLQEYYSELTPQLHT